MKDSAVIIEGIMGTTETEGQYPGGLTLMIGQRCEGCRETASPILSCTPATNTGTVVLPPFSFLLGSVSIALRLCSKPLCTSTRVNEAAFCKDNSNAPEMPDYLLIVLSVVFNRAQ